MLEIDSLRAKNLSSPPRTSTSRPHATSKYRTKKPQLENLRGNNTKFRCSRAILFPIIWPSLPSQHQDSNNLTSGGLQKRRITSRLHTASHQKFRDLHFEKNLSSSQRCLSTPPQSNPNFWTTTINPFPLHRLQSPPQQSTPHQSNSKTLGPWTPTTLSRKNKNST
jgi:hypothetical protein